MPKYTKISIKKELADAVDEFVKKHPDIGFRSIAEFVEDAMRRRAESLGILKYPIKTRFEHCNVYEDHVTIMDNEINKLIDVYFRSDKPFCEYCEESNCDHTRFILELPKVVKVLQEHGWVIEGDKIVRGSQ